MKTLTTPLNFFVEGKPRSKQSFKVSKKGHYIPAPTKHWQDICCYTARAELNKLVGWAGVIIEHPVSIELSFYMDTYRRVDGDNLEKCVMDGLKDSILPDDDIWHVRECHKYFYHVSDSPDKLAGVGIRIRPDN